MLKDQGETLPHKHTLGRILLANGKLVRSGDGRSASRQSIQKQQRSVYVVKVEDIWGGQAATAQANANAAEVEVVA